MIKKLFQHKSTIVSLVSYILIPVLFLLLAVWMKPESLNLSGLLANETYAIYFKLLGELVLLWTVWMLYQIKAPSLYAVLFLVSANLAFLFPYEAWKQLHLFFALSAFVLFHVSIFKVLLPNEKVRTFYSLVLITAFMICLKDFSISGNAEVCFGIGTSFTLGLLYKKSSH